MAVSSELHVAEHSYWLDVLAASSRAGKRNTSEFAFILDYEPDGRSHFYILLWDLHKSSLDAQGEAKAHVPEGGGKKGQKKGGGKLWGKSGSKGSQGGQDKWSVGAWSQDTKLAW